MAKALPSSQKQRESGLEETIWPSFTYIFPITFAPTLQLCVVNIVNKYNSDFLKQVYRKINAKNFMFRPLPAVILNSKQVYDLFEKTIFKLN